jgi:hypothetical protein
VDAAEHDVVGLRPARGCARELQRVADVVGELDHLVALIVVAQDHAALAQRGLRLRDPGVELVVREAEIALGKRLTLSDALLLVVG